MLVGSYLLLHYINCTRKQLVLIHLLMHSRRIALWSNAITMGPRVPTTDICMLVQRSTNQASNLCNVKNCEPVNSRRLLPTVPRLLLVTDGEPERIE
jgi:hypothetical protein